LKSRLVAECVCNMGLSSPNVGLSVPLAEERGSSSRWRGTVFIWICSFAKQHEKN